MKKLIIFILISIFFYLVLARFNQVNAYGCCPTLQSCGGRIYGLTCPNGQTCASGQVCCDACSLGQIGGTEGFGPWGNIGTAFEIGEAAGQFSKLISRIIGVMTIIAGLWFLFQFVIAGYGYMTSSGDSKRMSDAYNKITSSLIGLVVIVAAYAIISLIGAILGFDILNPQAVIQLLRP